MVSVPSVLCTGALHFVALGDVVQLPSLDLSGEPLVEDFSDLDKFATHHLPLHILLSAAASAAEGRGGPRTYEEAIETLGRLRVEFPSRCRLNDRMFVAQVERHFMGGRRQGMVNDALVVFEL